ncbi:family 78 glycoside hydrolase catalytic domain [Haloferula sp. A504]|uniref:family 78 glycoside hydrolase catalytic domain n=1 Tax=Haloferula sp. A504 TaxID=3373601 RepID=UPI0031C41C1E|nr:glycoside hydrolase family 78 protein [Verrucomicrobiaceae bacterium E54]
MNQKAPLRIARVLATGLLLQSVQAKPHDLKVCEGFTNPIGFHDATPTFSWKLADGVIQQRAYQLQVKGDVSWDSGWVESDQSVLVPYGSEELKSRQQAVWQVRYRDQDGEVSEWSEPAIFEMGLLSSADWHAKWIRPPVESSSKKGFVLHRAVYRSKLNPQLKRDVTKLLRKRVKKGMLRVEATNQALGGDPAEGEIKELFLAYSADGKALTRIVSENQIQTISAKSLPAERVAYLQRAFNISREVAQARLYVTARGLYEIRINGERVGEDYFAPGWTPYHKRIPTLAYDVTDRLAGGSNLVQSLLGTGWYAGRMGWGGSTDTHYGKFPELLLQLEIEYADGSKERVVSDESWQGTYEGPIVTSSIYDGEGYDARIPLGDWRPVVTRDLDEVRLVPKAHTPVRVGARLTPQAITEPVPGRFVFDLGQNMVGWPRLRVPVEKGGVLTVRFAEMLNQDGTLYTESYRTAHSQDYYFASETGNIDWEPTFTFHGFRYVELSGLPEGAQPGKDWVEGVVLYSGLRRTGTFESSHAKLNRLQQNIVWGQRGNFLEIPTDCPQRDERLGWTGDAQAFAATAMFNYDCHAFFKSWLRSMREEQRPDGHIPNVIPAVHTLDSSVGWQDAATIVPWAAYVRTGDREILADNFEMMENLVGWYRKRTKGGRVGDVTTYGDWLQPNAINTENNKGDTTPDYLGNAFYANNLRILADSAGILGKPSGKRYAQEAERVREAFVAHYFDQDGSLRNTRETQTAYVLALAFDLIPEELRPKAVGHLERLVAEAGGHLRTGFLGTPHLNRVLDANGRPELALSILFKESYPSWFFSINQGATTMWERWNSYSHKDGFGDARMNSFNHYAYGAVGRWMYERLAGLAPDPGQPGYKHFFVRPLIAPQLEFARAELDTPYGKAASGWRKEGDAVILTVVVPPNTSATIQLPAEGPDSVSISEDPDRLIFQRMENGHAVYRAYAGTHTLRSKVSR